jgi:hypothetical protein
MRRFTSLRLGLLAVALLTLTGCGAKLNYSKVITVQPGGTERIMFDLPLVDKATITIKSPGGAVDAYVVLESNVEAALRALEAGKEPDAMTKGLKTDGKQMDFAPGKKAFVLILVSAGKKVEVDVKAEGK